MTLKCQPLRRIKHFDCPKNERPPGFSGYRCRDSRAKHKRNFQRRVAKTIAGMEA